MSDHCHIVTALSSDSKESDIVLYPAFRLGTKQPSSFNAERFDVGLNHKHTNCSADSDKCSAMLFLQTKLCRAWSVRRPPKEPNQRRTGHPLNSTANLTTTRPRNRASQRHPTTAEGRHRRFAEATAKFTAGLTR